MELALTTRSQEALGDAVRRAAAAGHPHVEPAHLASGPARPARGHDAPAGAGHGRQPAARLTAEAERIVAGLPSASGATVSAPSLSRGALTVLEAAKEEADALGDQYVSTEHLLLGLTRDAGPLGTALKADGVTREGVLDALPQIRGSAKVTSPDPEATYDALDQVRRRPDRRRRARASSTR